MSGLVWNLTWLVVAGWFGFGFGWAVLGLFKLRPRGCKEIHFPWCTFSYEHTQCYLHSLAAQA